MLPLSKPLITILFIQLLFFSNSSFKKLSPTIKASSPTTNFLGETPVRTRSHVGKFICISMVNKKKMVDFHVFLFVIYVRCECVKVNIVLCFMVPLLCFERFFLFWIDFNINFLKIIWLTIIRHRGLCLRFILKFHFIKISNSTL